jgi:hypothetical protein
LFGIVSKLIAILHAPIFLLFIYCRYSSVAESKVKPSRYVMQTPKGNGAHLLPTPSLPRHQMGVSGQRHSPAALYPRETTPGTHWIGENTSIP